MLFKVDCNVFTFYKQYLTLLLFFLLGYITTILNGFYQNKTNRKKILK